MPLELTNDLKTGELLYPASVIDGTALSLQEFLSKKLDTENPQTKLCLFFIKEFYQMLAVSVQLDTEPDFHEQLEKIWQAYQSRLN